MVSETVLYAVLVKFISGILLFISNVVAMVTPYTELP